MRMTFAPQRGKEKTVITEIRNRLFSLIIILLGLSILTFGLTYILPSDPVEQLAESMGAGHDKEMMAKIEKKYGLDRPFAEQYLSWLKGVLHGDFGMSVKYAQPVSQVLGRKLPNTILLAVSSFVLMVVISFSLGILSAVYRNRAADYVIRFMSFIGISLPSFWIGMILIYLFSVKMHWLPVGGSDSLRCLIMPSITLSVSMSAYYIRRIRAVMVEQMDEEYINGCKARGLGRFRTIFFHVLPNSLLSIVTMLGISFGGMLGGTMIVETVFSWNGIGKAAVTAISSRDYQLIQGYVMWMGCIYVLINLAVDISYRWLDPRIRRGGTRHEE